MYEKLKFLKPVYLMGYSADRLFHLFMQYKAERPVISVGNICAGGTGKSTVTSEIVNYLKIREKKGVILSRGYGASCRENKKLPKKADPILFGDEPLMLSELTGSPVIIGKNRVKSIKKYKKLDPDYWILDDGFQYYRLKKNLSIVLFDAAADLSEYRLIPEGRMREPFHSLLRADIALITRCELAEKAYLCYLSGLIRGINPDLKVFEAFTRIRKWTDSAGRQTVPPEKAWAFSGLGNNSQFELMLKNQGVRIENFIPFPDHHCYDIEDFRRFPFDMPVITTLKDFVKIRDMKLPFLKNVMVPVTGFEIENDFYDLVYQAVLKGKISDKQSGIRRMV